MKVHVEFYGALKTVAKADRFELEITDEKRAKVFDVVELLVVVMPQLRPALVGVAYAVNDEVSDLKARVRSGDRVALLPPVSGG